MKTKITLATAVMLAVSLMGMAQPSKGFSESPLNSNDRCGGNSRACPIGPIIPAMNETSRPVSQRDTTKVWIT